MTGQNGVKSQGISLPFFFVEDRFWLKTAVQIQWRDFANTLMREKVTNKEGSFCYSTSKRRGTECYGVRLLRVFTVCSIFSLEISRVLFITLLCSGFLVPSRSKRRGADVFMWEIRISRMFTYGSVFCVKISRVLFTSSTVLRVPRSFLGWEKARVN